VPAFRGFLIWFDLWHCQGETAKIFIPIIPLIIGGGPLILFFPARCFEPAILEKGVCDHRHEGMTMQNLPRSAFKVIEAEFFLQLLVSLIANPTSP
jgi:hypothetical protein